jgi:hypothetical protein
MTARRPSLRPAANNRPAQPPFDSFGRVAWAVVGIDRVPSFRGGQSASKYDKIEEYLGWDRHHVTHQTTVH